MFSFLWAVIVGLVVGLIARALHPGRDQLGIVATILLGIGGSLAATYLGRLVGFYREGETAGFIMAVVGAVVLLVLYGIVKKRSKAG